MLKNKGMSKQNLVDSFMGGLIEELWNPEQIFKPTTVNQFINLDHLRRLP